LRACFRLLPAREWLSYMQLTGKQKRHLETERVAIDKGPDPQVLVNYRAVLMFW
jgi:hypothetical protein